MDLQYYFSKFQFFISLGYVTIISTFLTLIFTQIIKIILKEKGVFTNEIKQDLLLSQIGRIIALITYVTLYLINEIVLKHSIIIDKSLFIGLLTGSSLTLTLAKGIYTFLHQHFARKDIFERLEKADMIISQLQESAQETQKWILSSKKKQGELK